MALGQTLEKANMVDKKQIVAAGSAMLIEFNARIREYWFQMDVRESDYSDYARRRTDSAMDSSQSHFPKINSQSSSKLREGHMARIDIPQSRRTARSHQADAEFQLLNSRSAVQESNVKGKKLNVQHSGNSSPMSMEPHQYAQVKGELELVKRELSKLKLSMASILEEKTRARTTLQDARLKRQSDSTYAKALRNEMESANQEHILFEVPQLEASREAAYIQALRHKEPAEFSFAIEETKKKMELLRREIDPDQSTELEHELAVALADVSLLQNELKAAKDMDNRGAPTDTSKQREDNFGLAMTGGTETSHMLASITEELETAKKELASVREEGFQCMSSMDIIRNELKHVTGEIARLKKIEENADLKTKYLNSKLLRAKSKLEAASAGEEKTKSILTNLSFTLEQIQTEVQVSEKEKALIREETEVIKAEIQKTESEINVSEERLLAAMQGLEDVKSSEALALNKLKSLVENSMRVFNSQKNSKITISRFEYDYLTGRAVEAEEIADKKVAAAQAWIEAFKASEKEVMMKIEIAQRDLREMRMEEEREACRSDRPLSAKRKVEGESCGVGQKQEENTDDLREIRMEEECKVYRSKRHLSAKRRLRESRNFGQKQEKNTDEGQNLYSGYSRKPVKYRGKSSPYGAGHAESHKSASPATLGSTSVIIKKKTKAIPKLAKYLRGRKTSRDV